jgi:glucose/arabinose dehydrogenase
MRSLWRYLLPALLLGFGARAAERFELREGDRVLFLGDTFFEREGEYGALEARLTAAYPDRAVTYRNLSWSADTPMGRSRASFDWNKSEKDWLARVKEQVGLSKPTVAFLSYGMTAALERGAAGAAAFTQELSSLMQAVDEVGGEKTRFVILAPIQQQGERPDSPRTRDLEAVTAALQELAAARGATFVNTLNLSRQITRLRMVLYESPVILNEQGYQMLASSIAKELGLEAVGGEGLQILSQAVRHKNGQFFHRWRPANWTYLFGFRKHEQGRNAVEIPKFDPIVETWDQKIEKLRDLKNQEPAVVSEVRALAEPRQHVRDPNFREQTRPEFEVHPGFKAELWAENPQLFKPIQMNWDPQGRLWVASSRVYPQIRPGQDAEDAVVVLEDTDGDGHAEKSTVFADGLVIPTSVVPDGKGGCYVGASHQLLHFADADGDGRADRKTIVLSSFGTEDTHHNLHTLRWGFDGHLYMNQSIYTHTHVETAHGVRRLNSAGIWRFNPDTWQFDIFTKGGCNPWGHHWDQWGNQFFTDGAGFKGIYHAMEGATYFTYSDMRREAESISPGNYPKFCSLEIVHSPAFPADWQGQAITCDFRAHRIVRFALNEVGSTYQTVEQADLLRATNVTFRPIDLRFGPDGALYIADWSNPIIQHGEVDFRDPRRDKEHGRIWRVTGVSARTPPRRDLNRKTTRDLLDLTLSPNGWEQEQSRLVLRQRGADKVLSEAVAWLPEQKNEHARLEVLWLHEAFGRPAPALLTELTKASDPRLRAAAARQLAQ